MEHPGQTVLSQTALILDEGGGLEARFRVGLPAHGRRVAGALATELLFEVVPALILAAALNRLRGLQLARGA
jgi:hypothetical protein